MTSIKWSREAQADIAAIDAYYHALNAGYAERVARLAAKAVYFLAENPDAGPQVGNHKRKWRVAGTPYLLFYRYDGKFLRIVRIRHAAQDWWGRID